jgi:polysaccharide transporter, PST family
MQFVAQIWLARLINPSEYGLVAMVVPILGFISSMSDLGVGRALIQPKFISRSQITALFWINAVVSAAIALILVGISPLVGRLYHEPKTVAITIALAALFFVGTFGIHPSAILNRQMRLSRMAVIDCIVSVVGPTVGVLTALAGWGYWSLIYMQAANTLTSVLLVWLSAGWMPSWPRWDPAALQILRFGANLTISNIAIYITTTADNMIVGAVAGKIALGLYDKAYRLAVWPISQVSAPIGRVAIPLLSRLNDDPERYASAFKRMLQLPNLVCIPGLIFGMYFSPQLVHVFLGPSWSGIAPVFSWVCIGGWGSALYGSAAWLFTSQGRGREQMTWSVVTSAISVATFVIGIRWGAAGVAAVAGLGFTLVQTPLIIWAATRRGPVGVSFVLRAMLPILGSATATVPTVYLYSRIVHFGALAAIASGAILAYAVFILSMSAMASGRELLSGAAAIAFTYWNRVRVGLQHATT